MSKADSTSDTRRIKRAKALGTSPCIACGASTNTHIVVTGSPAWRAAALVRLGISEEEASTIVRSAFVDLVAIASGGEPIIVAKDDVPIWPGSDDDTITVRVCVDCAHTAGWTSATVGRPATHVVQPAWSDR